MTKALAGRSGVIHTFTQVINKLDVEEVVEQLPRKIDEFDILRFYCKVLDVEAITSVIYAPFWTNRAEELAKLYGIKLIESRRPLS